MHINSLDCSVRSLTPADLEEDGDSKEDRVVKTIFIQFVKLCQYMEGVLSLPLVPVESLEEQVRLCDSTLQQWLSNLPIEAQLNGKANEGTNTTLYRTLTHLTYKFVISVSSLTYEMSKSRANILMSSVVIISLRNFESKQEGNRPESQRLGFKGVQSVAVDSVNLLKTLISEDLVQTCPTQWYTSLYTGYSITICLLGGSVTTVLPPLIINLMGVRYAQSSQDYRISMAHYQTCMKFLKQLGEVYWHASFYHDLFKLAASHISATPHPQDAGVSENLREKLSSATVFSDNNPQCQFETPGCDLALEDDAFNRRPRSPVDYFVSARSPAPIFESNGNSVMPVFETAFNLESIETFDPGHVDDGGLNLRGVDIQALTEWLNQDGIFQSFFPSA
ncbi:hypothetical protein EIK77_007218 [Talaromyces pinophilus]|nr:hypothetical protein EIK77_007218 [Talaromyces pinophilus]